MTARRNQVVPTPNRLVIGPYSHVETYEGGQPGTWFIRIRECRREVCLSADEAIEVADFIRLVTSPASAGVKEP